MDIQLYKHHWHSRLQNELAAQSTQYAECNLYNIDIQLHNQQRHLYKIHVPGVREYLPRIDLGDTIMIRPLVPVLNGNIGQEAKEWSVSRDGLAPGFSGQEHHATVWSVLRRDEMVIVALGKFCKNELGEGITSNFVNSKVVIRLLTKSSRS